MLDKLNDRHLFLECHVGDYHKLCRLDRFGLFSNAIIASSRGPSVNITSSGLLSAIY